MSSSNEKKVPLLPNKNQCCFYKLVPDWQPKNQDANNPEVVSIIDGAAGNIRRWHDDDNPTQQWLIVPHETYGCRIQTRSVSSKPEYMAVDDHGNVVRWNESGHNVFTFHKTDKPDWFYIREPTNNEWVSVGDDGNLLRWAFTGKKGQKFKLMPVGTPSKPRELRQGDYTPYGGDTGAIPTAPKIIAWDRLPPERSKSYFIGEVTLPATMVDDPDQPNRLSQAENSPYYYLSREQYWDRGPGRGEFERWEKADSEKRTVTRKTGLTKTESESIEKTLRILVVASAEFNFKKGSAAFKTEIETALKTSSSESTTRLVETTDEVEIVKPSGSRAAKALWSLVDRYTLRDSRDNVVRTWEIVSPNTTDETSIKAPDLTTQVDKITLYPHDGFEGVGLDVTADTKQLPPGYDNEVSSIKVHAGEWSVFSQPDFVGRQNQQALRPDGGPNSDGRYPNPSTWGGAQDTISSVRKTVT